MSFSESVGSFMKGLGSAIFKVSSLKEILSSAIADGVEGGINRTIPLLMKSIILGAIFLTGVFLFGLGIAKWTETVFAIPGVGFVLTGFVLVGLGAVYTRTRRETE